MATLKLVSIDSIPSSGYYLVQVGELAGREIVTHKNQSSVSWYDLAMIVGITVLSGGVLLAHNLYQNYNRPEIFSQFDQANFKKYKIDAQDYQIQSIPKDHYASLKLDTVNEQKHFIVINEGEVLKCSELLHESPFGILKAFVKETRLKLHRTPYTLVQTTR